MPATISMITLGVSDLARSILFYGEGLGFERVPFDGDSIAFFEAGGPQLALYPRDALAEDALASPDGEGFRGFTLAQNFESSAEVDAALARAIEAGATLVKPAQAVFWGGYSGYFADHDGHLWEVACGSEHYAREQAEPDG